MKGIELDTVRVDVDKYAVGRVLIEFANVELSLTADQARQLADGLRTAANLAERTSNVPTA
jgi:hypothetical protein